MNIIDQIKAINGSAIANAIAKAFIIGFGTSAGYLVANVAMTSVGSGFDLGAFLPRLTDRVWLYLFFNESFKSGTAAAIGILSVNYFQPKNATPQTLEIPFRQDSSKTS